MATTTISIRKARGASYTAARRLGDVEAAFRGPGSYGKRVIRKKVYRGTNRALGKSLRGFGL